MTISAEVKRVLQNGTGSTATFSFNAPVDAVDDLKVFTYVIATGAQTTQTRGGSATYDYNVSINTSTKFATITLNNNLPATHRIVMLRDIAITQVVDYVEGDPFPAETHEGALDKLTLINTMLSEQVDRSLKVLESSATTGLSISELTANSSLLVNSSGDGVIMGPDASTITGASTSAAAAAASAGAASASATTASGAASTATSAAASTGLPTMSSTYAGYYVRAKADASGYEFIAPPQSNATFYGFKITGSTLQLDFSVIGTASSHDVNDYRDYNFGAAGLVYSINSSGHLIGTFP
tara:strand:+ start:6631 stop:7521 length:891 start_codon:yes stop_codon:yes gene_type:complete